MEIKLKEIKIRDIVNGYINNEEDGVSGYGGKLNIRPKYQREFVYKDKQRDAVIKLHLFVSCVHRTFFNFPAGNTALWDSAFFNRQVEYLVDCRIQRNCNVDVFNHYISSTNTLTVVMSSTT